MPSVTITGTASQYAANVIKPNFSTGFTPTYGIYAKESVGSWPTDGTTGNMQVVSDVTAHQNDKSYLLTVTGGSENNFYGVTKALPSAIQRYGILNAQIVMKVPAGYDFTAPGYSLKFLRFKTVTAADANVGYSDIYIKPSGAMFYIHEGVASSYVDATAGYEIQRDVWETIEYRVVLDSVSKDAGGQGRSTLWIKRGNNYVKIIDQTSKPTLASSTDKSNLFLVFTYWNGLAPKNQTMNIQRVVVQTDQSAMFAVADGMKIIGGEFINA